MASDYTVGTTIYKTFTTRRFSTGAPFTLAGSPVVSAYENDSVTQITAGITLGVDHDGVVGLNLLTLVLTGANGYETKKDYNFVITTGTVDSVSVVGETVLSISLGRTEGSVLDAVMTLHQQTGSLGRTLGDPLASQETIWDAVIGDAAGTNIAADIATVLTTQMTEAYAADGVAPTLAQAVFLIQQTLTDFKITGNSYSVKGLDGTTEKAVLTLNDATNPTAITRSS